MVAKRGSLLIIKRGDAASPEVFTQIGAIQNSTWAIAGNSINVTTADDVDGNNEIWNTFITGPKDGTITANGISKGFLPIQTIYNDFATGTAVNYEIIVPNVGTWTAAMIIGDMSFDGPFDGVVGFDITMQMSGAPVFVAET